jgi:hypothetical protein
MSESAIVMMALQDNTEPLNKVQEMIFACDQLFNPV